MNTSVTKPTERAKNYSDEQVKVLTENSPMNLEGAKALAETDLFKDKSYQSIISKIKNLGLEYIPKPAPRKKAVQATKPDLVSMIEGFIDRDLSGLEKANRQSILNLINGIQHIMPPKEEPELPELSPVTMGDQ